MKRYVNFFNTGILGLLLLPSYASALNVGTDWTNTDKNLNTTGSITGNDITATGKITPSAEGVIYNQGDAHAVDTTIENKLSTQLRSVSDYSSLVTALTDISTTETDLFCVGEITIPDGVTATVLSTITWIPRRNCLVKGVAGGGTEILAINGPIIASPGFRWIGSNLTLSGTPDIEAAWPDWYTVNTTPGTTNMTTALQTIVNWVPSKVHLDDAVYSYTSLTLPQYTIINGVRQGLSELKSTYAGNTLTLSNDVTLNNLTLNGASKVAGSVGIYGDGKHRFRLNGVEIKSFEKAISATGGIFWRIDDSNIHDNVDGLKVVSSTVGFNNNTIDRTKFVSNTGKGIWLEYGGSEISTNRLSGSNVEDNATGVYLLGAYNTVIDATFFEGQTENHIETGDSGAIYTTGLAIDNSRLNTMDAGKGVLLNGSTQDVSVNGGFLKDHDWINNSLYTVYISNTEEVGSGMVYDVGKFIRSNTSQTWGKSTSLTSNNYERITLETGNSQDRYYTVTTSDATETTIGTFGLTDEKSYWIDASILGKNDDNSGQVYCHIGGVFYRDGGGVATRLGNNVSLIVPPAITDPANTPADADALRDDLVTNTIPSIEVPYVIESVAGTGCNLDVSGNNVRARGTGIAATPMTWFVRFNVIEL